MLSRALEESLAPQLAVSTPAPLAKTIRQDPRAVAGGKLRIHFRTTDLGGAPEALRLGETIYTVAGRTAKTTRADGQPATATYYEVNVPPFTSPGAYAAEIRIGAIWRPLTLFILIALH